MANTRRESTAFHRSEDATDAAGSGPIPALGFGPHLSTADHAIRQETSRAVLPLRDPAISLIVRAVDTAFALHNKKDGATVSLPYGDMAGRKFFAVSTYPARTIKLWERPTWEQLFDFAKANLELLLKPNHAIGTWYDGWECVHVFDVVLLVADRDAALETALRFGQKAIFNLASRREISVLRPNAALLQHGGGVGNG